MTEVTLCGRQWRFQLECLVREVKTRLLIVCPFIKRGEADFISACLGAVKADVHVLTNLRMDSVVGGALDIDALVALNQFSPGSRVLTLPGLHAKVFIADCGRAIITSGNLTRSGLDHNHEYGVLLRGAKMVARVRKDMERCVQAGSVADVAALREIARLARPLVKRRGPAAVGKGEAALRQALARVQVGARSANAVFSAAICRVLEDRKPRATRKLHEEIQQLLPDLCNDAPHLTVNGNVYGKKWKHRVRNAQTALRKGGRIFYDQETRCWALR